MVTSRQSAQEAGWKKKEKELDGEIEEHEQGEKKKGKKEENEKGRKKDTKRVDEKVL